MTDECWDNTHIGLEEDFKEALELLDLAWAALSAETKEGTWGRKVAAFLNKHLDERRRPSAGD